MTMPTLCSARAALRAGRLEPLLGRAEATLPPVDPAGTFETLGWIARAGIRGFPTYRGHRALRRHAATPLALPMARPKPTGRPRPGGGVGCMGQGRRGL